MGSLIPFLTLIVVTMINGIRATSTWTDNCRVQCLMNLPSQHPEYKHAYKRYAELMTSIRRIHAQHDITGTVLLYDNTIFVRHSDSSSSGSHSRSSSSSSSSSFEDDFIENNTTLKLEKFQQMLAVLVLAATPTGQAANNPVYWAQFDDLSAWSCAGWRCAGGCSAMELMFTDLNKFTESKRKGRLDEACYIAEVAQNDHRLYCGGDSTKRLAIAIVNSPFDFPKDSSSSSSSDDSSSFDENPSCCGEYRHRMAIGHYRASEEDLKKFSTYEKDGIYMHMKDHHEYLALESLVSCMTNCGCSFSPSDFSNTRSLENVRTSQGGSECQITQPRLSYQIYTKGTVS